MRIVVKCWPLLFGQMYVAPTVLRLVRRHEKLQVKVLLYDRVVDLLEEGIDAGIRIGKLDDSSLVAQPVSTVRRMVVASPDYLRRAGVPKHPRDLLKANCVRFSGSSGQWWTFYEGMGFGMFISYQVAPYLGQKKLRLVLEDFESPPQPISIVYPHARLLPARTRVFVE